MAMCELGDYFSRLGGAARPRNMAESEIPLYVGCKLMELHDNSFQPERYLDPMFIEAAEPVLEKTDYYLQSILLDKTKVAPFVAEFYEYADSKLKETEKTKRWELFGEYLRGTDA